MSDEKRRQLAKDMNALAVDMADFARAEQHIASEARRIGEAHDALPDNPSVADLKDLHARANDLVDADRRIDSQRAEIRKRAEEIKVRSADLED